MIAGGLLLVVVVAAATVALFPPTEERQGARGLAARVRGGGWQRAEVRGASVAFPTTPVRRPVDPGPGLPLAGESLASYQAGLRTELVVADVAVPGTLVDGPAVSGQLVAGYAARNGGRVVQLTSLYRDGVPGMDAVVEADGDSIRVRAMLDGTTGYLLAVVGSSDAFRRFTDSFRRPDPAGKGSGAG